MKNLRKKTVYATVTAAVVIFLTFAFRLTCINSCRAVYEDYLQILVKSSVSGFALSEQTDVTPADYSDAADICRQAILPDIKSAELILLDDTGQLFDASLNSDNNKEEKLELISADPFLSALNEGKTVFFNVGSKRVLIEHLDDGGSIVFYYDNGEMKASVGFNIFSSCDRVIRRCARLMLNMICAEVSSLVENGCTKEDILLAEDYFKSKLDGVSIASLDGFTLSRCNAAADLMEASPTDGLYVYLRLNRSYMSRLYLKMLLTFAATMAVFVVIALEFFNLGKIGTARLKVGGGGKRIIPIVVRFFTFFVYLAVYVSLPYGAIIIRERQISAFGIPAELLSGVPVFIFCVGIIAAQIFGGRLLKSVGFKRYMVIMAAFGALPAALCVAKASLMGIFAFSAGIGLCAGFERYLMNNIVPLCADTDLQVNRGYGFFNAGLLNGLTFGGSLGGILAQIWDYESTYRVSCILLAGIVLLSLVCMPFGYLVKRQKKHINTENETSLTELLRLMKKNKFIAAGLLITSVPVSLGLMFIVSFMPIYISGNSLPSLTSAYAYLLYGIAGGYFGLVLLKLMSNVKQATTTFFGLCLIAASVLVLTLGSSLPALMLSVLLAGLFDGFGSVAVMSVFVNANYAGAVDKSLLLTAASILGGIVSAISPFIYGLIIDTGNITANLICLSVFFVFCGILIFAKERTR